MHYYFLSINLGVQKTKTVGCNCVKIADFMQNCGSLVCVWRQTSLLFRTADRNVSCASDTAGDKKIFSPPLFADSLSPPVNVTITAVKANSAVVTWDIPEGDPVIGFAITQQVSCARGACWPYW